MATFRECGFAAGVCWGAGFKGSGMELPFPAFNCFSAGLAGEGNRI